MKNKLLFNSSLVIAILYISSCVSSPNLLKNNLLSYKESSTQSSYDTWIQKEKNNFLEQFKKKNKIDENINIKINTGLFEKSDKSKVFTVKSDDINSFNIKDVPEGKVTFQESFNLDSNKKLKIQRNFSILDTSKRYTLYVKRTDERYRNNDIRAIVNINGQDIIRNRDFKCGDEAINESLLLNSNNIISIELHGKVNSNFTIMIIEDGQAGTIRKRKRPLGEHETNQKHINTGDNNIFNPNDLSSLGGLQPYQGDLSLEDNSKFSTILINGENPPPFETGVLVIKFRKPEGLSTFQSLYNAEVLEEKEGFYKLKLDLTKSPINKIEDLLDKYSEGLPQNITDVEFSSVEALKTFAIHLDFLVNHYNLVESIELNLLGELDKVYTTNSIEWDGGMSGVLSKLNANSTIPPTFNFDCTQRFTEVQKKQIFKDPSGNPIFDSSGSLQYVYRKIKLPTTVVSSGWSITTGNTDFVNNNIATGKGIKTAVIDGGAFILNHTDMYDKSLNSRYQIDTNYTNFSTCLSRNCNKDSLLQGKVSWNHGHSATMVGYARKNIETIGNYKIGTTGIATEATVIPYHEASTFGWSTAIYRALAKGSKVISMSMGIGRVPFWLKAWKPNGTITDDIRDLIYTTYRPSFLYDAIHNASLANIPFVVSAGNGEEIKDPNNTSNTTNMIKAGFDRIDYVPADSPDAIVVGAVSPVRYEEDNYLAYSATIIDSPYKGIVPVDNNTNPSRKISLTAGSSGVGSLSQLACGISPELEDYFAKPSLVKYNINDFDTSNAPFNNDPRLGFSIVDSSNYGENVVWAPGKYLFIPDPYKAKTSNVGKPTVDIYDLFSGTSASCPYVAGTIALIKEVAPNITVSQIKKLLKDASTEQVRSSYIMRYRGFQEFDPSIKFLSVENALTILIRNQGIMLQTSAESIYGIRINEIIASAANTIGKEIKKLEVKLSGFSGSLFLGAIGVLEDVNVTVDGKQAQITGKDGSIIAFKLPEDLSSGVKDVIVTSNGTSINFAEALEIIDDLNPYRNSIAFDSNRDGNQEIYVMDEDGSNQRRLTFTSNRYDYGATWSPNKEKIAFDSEDYSGEEDIFVVNPDGTGMMNLTNSPDDEWDPFWSYDSKKITYTSDDYTGDDDIWEINADGTNRRQLTNDPEDEYNSSYSPDGSKIVYVSEATGTPQIFIMNSDGSNKQQLTDNPYGNDTPKWSMTGKKISWESYTANNDSHIWQMNPDGSGKEQLTFHDDYRPWYSPDGTKMAYHTYINSSRRDIKVLDLRTRIETNLTGDNPSKTLFSGWFNDGSRVLYSSKMDGDYEIYSQRYDGSDLRQLTFNTADDFNAAAHSHREVFTTLAMSKSEKAKIARRRAKYYIPERHPWKLKNKK